MCAQLSLAANSPNVTVGIAYLVRSSGIRLIHGRPLKRLDQIALGVFRINCCCKLGQIISLPAAYLSHAHGRAIPVGSNLPERIFKTQMVCANFEIQGVYGNRH
ncbi:hypothetical protein AVEN_266892-1 [Araneus ventricosus]|uniref:Uncharacterized protein n=1 Tax=Araneus ventricosus TaxID=182803 RepID=A0A4Y2SI50_ARAVE|nr:hypothetical protein AVEN_266892-1 [Araneus ventricosus]